MANTERRAFLGKLLGEKKTSELEETLAKARQTLDAAGVARKAEGDTPAEAAAVEDVPAVADTESEDELVAMLAQKLSDYLKDQQVAVTDAMAADLLSLIQSVYMDAEKADSEDDTADAEDVSETIADVIEQNKALAGALLEQQEDMGVVVEAATAILKTQKSQDSLATSVKSIQDLLTTLDKRMAVLESVVSGRPRMASAAPETEIENTQLTQTMKQQLATKDPFWNTTTETLS
jgi:hypothetical protein